MKDELRASIVQVISYVVGLVVEVKAWEEIIIAEEQHKLEPPRSRT
jgi:hypothetical protein